MAAFVDASKCVSCGVCVDTCPMSAITMEDTAVVDAGTCVDCGACGRACGMNVDPHRIPNSTECIRCGECMKACPVHALKFTAAGKEIRKSKGKKETAT